MSQKLPRPHRHARPKDGVLWEEFVVTDRLDRLPRLETPLTASPRERGRGIVIRADQRAVGQSLSPLVIKAQRPGRAGKSFTVKVPQQFVDGRRPWATYAPNCLTDPDDPRVRTTGERKLWLNHVACLAVARSGDEQAKAELRLVKVEDVPVPLGPTT